MPSTLRFYMDDSGTRRPNHEPLVLGLHEPQHFALGGILIRDEDVSAVKQAHSDFCSRWRISYPLHSVDIRNRSKNFGWLRLHPESRDPFLEDLERFLTGIPVVGLACVIDRPGYDDRYRLKYGRNQWHLCQTAFVVAVERACKYAMKEGRRLRVCPEQCSKAEDGRLRQYFENMRTQGHPFSAETSAPYGPLSKHDFSSVLYEIEFKTKASQLAQIADLYLWPMAKQGYGTNRPFTSLRTAGRIIDCHLSADELLACGVKYSCFERIDTERQVA
jgi:hypothetical protein